MWLCESGFLCDATVWLHIGLDENNKKLTRQSAQGYTVVQKYIFTTLFLPVLTGIRAAVGATVNSSVLDKNWESDVLFQQCVEDTPFLSREINHCKYSVMSGWIRPPVWQKTEQRRLDFREINPSLIQVNTGIFPSMWSWKSPTWEPLHHCFTQCLKFFVLLVLSLYIRIIIISIWFMHAKATMMLLKYSKFWFLLLTFYSTY